MDASNSKVSGVWWLITFLAIYFIGITIWVGMGVKQDSLIQTLINERTSNSELIYALDDQAWSTSKEWAVFSGLANMVNNRITNSNDIVSGQKGFVENVIDETPVKLSLYGSLLDYRLSLAWLLAPILIIFFLVTLVDGLTVRKIQSYRNSFSSPLRHTIGGKVLGINLGILLVFGFFAPIAIPFWVFTVFVFIKIFGWWLWAVNLPKRM
ncbi:hypothetical protein JCM30760_26080 [Thiomicrorhabdus hydrogeniphila]